MPSLNIRHVTTYRYRSPVSFGEHRMMFRPRDSHDQKVIGANLEISPDPSSLRFFQDAFGNHVGIARFSSCATELRFESSVRVEHLPSDVFNLGVEDLPRPFPITYAADEFPDIAHCIERSEPDPENEVSCWARQFLPASSSIQTLEFLVRLSKGIHQGFVYRRREARGIQRAVETLRLGHGTCRDFAMLMIEASRSLGLAARFASGYLAIARDETGQPTQRRGATHAWAQIYVPGAGWIDFDPTRGSAGNGGLVTVAVVRNPRHATPLHGTFVGSASDHLGMEVQVSVTPDSPQAICADCERTSQMDFSQLV
jgi:transglutaminase-like putative cysteine protease